MCTSIADNRRGPQGKPTPARTAAAWYQHMTARWIRCRIALISSIYLYTALSAVLRYATHWAPRPPPPASECHTPLHVWEEDVDVGRRSMRNGEGAIQ